MTYRALGLLVLSFTAIGACSAEISPPPVAPSQLTTFSPPMVAPGVRPSGVLPAFETAAERATRGKFDSNDDFRIKYKSWYAQTDPPEPGRFRPFGEWEKMASVWTTYTNGMVNTPAVRRMFAEQTIHFVRDSKPVVEAKVIVNSNNAGNDFLKALDQNGMTASEKKHVQIVKMPNNTIWHIDYGVFPLVDKKTGLIAFADWVYYKPRILDDAIPTRLANGVYQATVYRTPFPFEGGNIQTDGVGTCATTTRALQNTGYSSLKVRNILDAYAGCNKTLIVKDITDDGTGHLDMFFKWIDSNTVLVGRYEDSITLDYDGNGKSETLPMPGKVATDYAKTWKLNQQRMNDDAALFGCVNSANGSKYKVHRLSMMTRFKDDYGDLPRTFINSTFANGANVYPSYATNSCRSEKGKVCMQDSQCAKGQHCASARCTPGPAASGCDPLVPCDGGLKCVKDPLKVALTEQVQAQWQKVMPNYKHVGLRADTIALWSGAIHCITRTIPTGAISKAIADGKCVGGKCNGADGGTVQSCTSNKDCTGPKWKCDCNICKGKCASGAICTDDADCSSDGLKVTKGACKVDPNQTCYTGAIKPNSCADKCGNYKEGAACQCDDQCASYKDCCSDYKELCVKGSDPMSSQCDKDAGGSDAGPTDTGAKDAGCQPQCQGQTCGDDGCGGACGTCTDGKVCGAEGQCVGGSDAGPADQGSPDLPPEDIAVPDDQSGGSADQNGGAADQNGGAADQTSDAADQTSGVDGKTGDDDGQAGGTDSAQVADVSGANDGGQPPIGASDGGDNQAVPMAHMTGRSSTCQAGGPQPAGGLSMLLCLLLLAWRRRPTGATAR